MAESIKNDYKDDKLRRDLLPLDLIEEVVKVYHFGAKSTLLIDGKIFLMRKADIIQHLCVTCRHIEKEKQRTRKAGFIRLLMLYGTGLHYSILQ